MKTRMRPWPTASVGTRMPVGDGAGGTTAYSRTPGAQATFTFTGTSVTWIGHRSGNSGIARVFVDGVFVSDVDLFSWSSELRVPVFTATGLSNSSHTLTIEVTGLKNENSLDSSYLGTVDAVDAVVVVDAFDVPSATISRLQETDPSPTPPVGARMQADDR